MSICYGAEDNSLTIGLLKIFLLEAEGTESDTPSWLGTRAGRRRSEDNCTGMKGITSGAEKQTWLGGKELDFSHRPSMTEKV